MTEFTAEQIDTVYQLRQAIVLARDGKTAYVLNEDLSLSKVEREGQRIVATVAASQAVAQY